MAAVVNRILDRVPGVGGMPRNRQIILVVAIVVVVATTLHLLALASPWATGWEMRSPFESAAQFHLRMLIWHGRETKDQAGQSRHAAALVAEGESAIPVLTDALLANGLNPRFHPQPLEMLEQLPRTAVTAELKSRLDEERTDLQTVRLFCGLFEMTGELTYVRDVLALMIAEHARVQARLDAQTGGRTHSSYSAGQEAVWFQELHWIVVELNNRYGDEVPGVSEDANSVDTLLEWVELQLNASKGAAHLPT